MKGLLLKCNYSAARGLSATDSSGYPWVSTGRENTWLSSNCGALFTTDSYKSKHNEVIIYAH